MPSKVKSTATSPGLINQRCEKCGALRHVEPYRQDGNPDGILLCYFCSPDAEIDRQEARKPSSHYRWIILVDHLAEPGTKPGTNDNAVGLMGPHNCDPAIPCGLPFRMSDDDKVLYYEGKASRVGFEPLDDFGAPNAGCTIIEFLSHAGTWEVL